MFWRERAEGLAAYGPVFGALVDLAEGGPPEWLAAIRRAVQLRARLGAEVALTWLGHASSNSSSSSSSGSRGLSCAQPEAEAEAVVMTPGQKIDRLLALQRTLLTMVRRDVPHPSQST
jgi:hypothetical protein